MAVAESASSYRAAAPRLPWLARALTPRALVLGGVMLATLAAVISPEADPDFWWHVRIGRWMLAHGLPEHDIFTFTVPGHVWTDHEWLTEVLMASVFGWGGMVAIAVGFGLLTWAGFWLLLAAARPSRQPYVIAGLGLALAVGAAEPILGPRAQMITFLFACLELYWLRGYLAGRSRMINWLPLLMVAWVNLHGGFVVGFAFLGLALVVEALRWLGDRSDLAARAHLRRLALIGAASLLAATLNPHGLSIYGYVLRTIGSPAQEQLIVEWFSPDFHRNDLKVFELMVMLLFAGFTLRRPSLYDLLLSFAVLGLALQSVRNVALFVAATTPILIVTWSGIWRDLAERRRWTLGNIPQRPLLAATTGLALAVIAVATTGVVAGHLQQQGSVTRQEYPVAAADWIAAHPDQVGTRAFNQYGWGGYLAYRFYPDPDRRVFIFGEAELMGDDLLNRYQDVAALHPNWVGVLDDYRVDTVIFNRGAALSNVLATEPRWKLVYEDAVADIYVRAR